jgi:hypothetical protein
MILRPRRAWCCRHLTTTGDPPPPLATRVGKDRYIMYGLEAGFNEVRADLTNIDGVRKGGFTVNGKSLEGPLVFLRDLVLLWKRAPYYSPFPR